MSNLKFRNHAKILLIILILAQLRLKILNILLLLKYK